MRKLSLFLTLLVLIMGGAMAAIVYLVPPEFYKQKIEEQASAMLGRELRIKGQVTLRLWPTLQARAQNVTLANPPGFSEPHFATMKAMRASVAIVPLFSRRIEIKEFVLVEPKIVLERRANGAVNWIMGTKGKASVPPSTSTKFKRKPGALPLEASLGDIRLIEADVRYIDHIEDSETQLSKVNLDLNMPALNAPMSVKGSLVLDGQPYALNAMLGGIQQFMDGARTPISLNLENDLFSIAFDGAFDQSEKISAQGQLSLNVPSVRKLAAFAGTELADNPDAYGAFSVSGTARANIKRFAFDDAKLAFDDITGTGRFGVVFAGSKPVLSGELAIPELDVTRYLPPTVKTTQGIPAWSTTTFDLAALKAVDARFTLSLNALRMREIKIGKSTLEARLENGRLQADLSEMTLYDGRGSATMVVNARGKAPSFSLAANIAKVAFQPLLTDAIKFRRLAGTGAASFSLSGAGSSQADIMHGLSGSGDLRLQDGKIIGVNLAAVLRKAQSFLSTGTMPASLNEEKATDFTDLTASFKIADGVAQTNDFLMLSPLIRVPGEGMLDIGNQMIDFRLTPRAVASLEGQGGKADLMGIKAPFRIHGPWNAVKAGLDTKLIKKKAKKRAKKEIGRFIDNNLSGDTGSALKSMLGLQETTPDTSPNAYNGEPQQKTDEEQAVDALIGLFKKKKKKKKNNNNP
ncbi:MAG: hypothetical protein COA85_12865 [Robiginitomaculum sp.]|nr:MAG: hypothetical protein COA85_12865 [Robiginitomaculum sp.]